MPQARVDPTNRKHAPKGLAGPGEGATSARSADAAPEAMARAAMHPRALRAEFVARSRAAMGGAKAGVATVMRGRVPSRTP